MSIHRFIDNIKPAVSSQLLAGLALAAVVGLGGWLRWRYLHSGTFQIDEFISMLAIRMILDKGAPILPSGLFYDHGLVFSYIGALFAALGGDLWAARWWSLIAGLLAIVAIFAACWRLFGSPGWGLLAAVGLAFNPEALEWSGRVRMYSQANLILILWILLAWWGTLGGGRRWARWALLLTVMLGVYSHLVLLLAAPPLVIALALTALVDHHYRLRWADLRQKLPWPELGAATLVLAAIVWTGQRGFVASHTIDSTVPESAAAAANPDPISDVISLEVGEERWGELSAYLQRDSIRPLAGLALIGGLAAVVAVARRRLRPADLAGVFVALLLSGVIAEMLIFIANAWHEARYYFLLILPPLLLLAAYGGLRLVEAGHLVLGRVIAQPALRRGVIAGLLLLIGGLWAWPLWREAQAATTEDLKTPNAYHLAFAEVNRQRDPADQVATVRPEAGYLFSNTLEYYINAKSPVLIPGPAGGWIDGYAGAPYLGDVAALQAVLDRPGALWIVSDDDRLFHSLEPIFAQVLLWRTQPVAQIGNVLILRENGKAIPTQAFTAPPLATLVTGAQLAGYELSGALGPGQTVQLATFWRRPWTLWLFKIFVHLRDASGRTVAQADFTPLDQIDPRLQTQMVAAGSDAEVMPLLTSLTVPADLPPGRYRLYIGVYHPQTFDRAPVVNDTSGDNSILLQTFDLVE